MAHIVARNVIGKEMIVLIRSTTTVELNIAATGFFAEVGKLGEVLAAKGY